MRIYKIVIRPLLFLFNPERIHHVLIDLIKIFLNSKSFVYSLTSSACSCKFSQQIDFCGIKFKNRIGLAAGFDKNAEVFDGLSAFGFSFIEIGTITPEGQPGNPKPRLFRLKKDKALINRMGFNNHGIENAVKNLKKGKRDIIIGGNIGKNTLTDNSEAIKDYKVVFNNLYDHVDYLVINVSCPNIKDLGKLSDTESLSDIINELNKSRSEKPKRKPILVKISPDLSTKEIDNIVSAILNSSADGIIATNTTKMREGLQAKQDKLEKIGDGGLSGLPLKQRSTELIKYISVKTENKLPIIASGGVLSPDDALEKIKAGATLVQFYTGFIYEGPSIVKRTLKLFEKNGI